MNKIPNEIIFGQDGTGKAIDYGFVRAIKDDTEVINFFRLRFESYLIQQVMPLRKSSSAFPLAVMTCIGIETLGEIFIPEDNDDTSFQFTAISKKVSQVFGR